MTEDEALKLKRGDRVRMDLAHETCTGTVEYLWDSPGSWSPTSFGQVCGIFKMIAIEWDGEDGDKNTSVELSEHNRLTLIENHKETQVPQIGV
jgi:hypothetical protein